MAQWLSWLERRPVTAEVESSSLFWVVVSSWKHINLWDLSSAGRASALQAEGHRFEPYRSHLLKIKYGRFPEWPKGTDCKSAANCFGGSNPPPSTLADKIRLQSEYADVAQLAEQLICNQQVIGSSPIIGFSVIIFIAVIN